MRRLVLTTLVMVLATAMGLCQSISSTYKIQEEDRLLIQVFDENQIQAEVVVTPDGKIAAPFGGILVAVGKTTADLEAELADIYEKRLRIKNPKVSVTIRAIRKITATIGGAVGRANTFEVRPGQRVSDLAAMGGADNRLGDLRKATFRRKGWIESVPIDLMSVGVGNPAQNYELMDGDSVYVPEKRDYVVRVTGEVNAPRNVEFVDGMNLVAAITSAGGPTAQKAKQTKVVVVRQKAGTLDQYYMIECNLINFYKKGDFAQNIKLLPGDTVYVPNNGNPDFSLFNSIANALFILDRIGISLPGLGGGGG